MQQWQQRILGSGGPYVGLGPATLGAFGRRGRAAKYSIIMLPDETLKGPSDTLNMKVE